MITDHLCNEELFGQLEHLELTLHHIISIHIIFMVMDFAANIPFRLITKVPVLPITFPHTTL